MTSELGTSPTADTRPDPLEPRRRLTLRGIRRIAILLVVVSLASASALGIWSLLTWSFGDAQWKIIATTAAFGGFSLTALCHLTIARRAYRFVGHIGLLVSAAALFLALCCVWGPFDQWVATAFAATTVLAFCFAHANLLLIFAESRSRVVRVALWTTIGAIAVTAAMICAPIIDWRVVDRLVSEEQWFRALGAVAILDVLGSIVLPIANQLRRRPA